MALPLDQVPSASFDGIEFPYTTLDVDGSLDHHVHKYLHRAGGEVESLGRHVYQFRFGVLAHAVYRRYPNFYPLGLNSIINRCESERTLELRVPTMGIYRVKAIKWTRSISQAKKSGEQVELVFIEDNTEQFTVENIVGPAVAALPTQAIVLDELTKPDSVTLPAPLRLKLEALLDAVNEIVAQRDDALADVELAQIQVGKAMGLCHEIDTAPYFRDPTNAIEMRAFHDVWDTLTALAVDRLTKQRAMGTYVTQRPMSIVEVSLDIYKSTAKVQELLRLNYFDHAMMIPTATEIAYYPPHRSAA